MKHYLVIFGILFFIIISLSSINANAESPVNNKISSPQLQQNNDPNETILKYEEFLRSESKEHRDYLESFYTKIIWIISGVCAIALAILAFFNWKSKKDVSEEVKKLYEKNIQKKFTELLENHKQNYDKQIEQLTILLNENKEKSKTQIEELEANVKMAKNLIFQISPQTPSNKTQAVNKPYNFPIHKVAFINTENKKIPYEIEFLKDINNINLINVKSPQELTDLIEKIDLIITPEDGNYNKTLIPNNIPRISLPKDITNVSSGTQFIQEIQQHLNEKSTTE